MRRYFGKGYFVLLSLFLLSFVGTSLLIDSGKEEYTKVVIANPPAPEITDKNTDKPIVIPGEEKLNETPLPNNPKENKPKERDSEEDPSEVPPKDTPEPEKNRPDENKEENKNPPDENPAEKCTITKDYETKFEEIFKTDGIKTVYLTFDDGPSSKVTPQILDILKSYDIKATFFVVGNQVEYNKSLLKRELEEGHSIALHSYSHDYGYIYSNLDAFKSDFIKVERLVKNILGESFSTRIYRFPGGSFGSKKDVSKQYINQIGYQYIDWNTLTGDTEYIVDSNGNKKVRNDPQALIDRFIETLNMSGNKEDLVVLMHDLGSKQSTADALPGLIDLLKSKGYMFKVIK
jgi:peptidoglycan/xylan/chitin deacetylase (PgdA/CDA1 family)